MEKRLRSSLQSSAEEFLSSAIKLNLKSSKPTLKTLIHAIKPNSDVASSLPLSLLRSISLSITSFQNLQAPSPSAPDPAKSPPAKRLRRSSRYSKSWVEPNSQSHDSNLGQQKQQVLDNLQVLSYIALLCVSNPKKAFLASDLLPGVRALHDHLIVFEADSVLSSEIANVCEEWWKENMPGRELLISQFIPFLVSRSLTLKKKADVHRVYMLRDAFNLFDFDDESIEDLKLLLIRCVIAPLYLKTEDGRRFLAYVCGLNGQLLKEALAMIKSQVPFGRKSMLEAYGDILFRAWKGAEGDLREEIENGFLQCLVEGTVYASSGIFAASTRRVLSAFINQRTTDGIEKLLFRLAEPVIFRSLQVANSNVRQNALHLLLDIFPLEDPEATKEVKDTLLDKQFFLLERLLLDDCPNVRVVAVEGCCRILHLFWEIIPSSTISKILTKIIDDMSHDICNEIRLSTLNGIIYLLGNPQSHEILKVLLPRLSHLMMDNVLSVRVAVADLLLLIRDIRTFQFHKVVGLDVLLLTLANDQFHVAQKITRLLMPSYFPSRVTLEEACSRCVTLLKRSSKAGARFCEFAASEGAPLKSLLELVKVLINLVSSNNKLDTDQVEGLLVAASFLCKSLAREPTYKDALRELFSGGKLKCLFAAASTAHAQSSVFNIVTDIALDSVGELVEECMSLVTNCNGLSGNVEKQAEVRSAHKLLLSCDAFDDMFDALTRILQKAAYRCHIKFDIQLPKQHGPSAKRKKCKSSVKLSTKWKHVSGKKSAELQEDYSLAVGVAWQMKDLLSFEDTQKVILFSPTLELPFFALKVISEVSILQCMNFEYMNIYPVLAYTAVALQMTLHKVSASGRNDSGGRKNEMTGSLRSFPETVLDQTIDHLLNCTDKLFEELNSWKSGNLPPGSIRENKVARNHKKQHREPERDASSSGDGGNYPGQKSISKMVKMLTAVLMFIVDSTAMGLVSHFHARCLTFTSAYIKYIIGTFGHQSSAKLLAQQEDMKETILCLKISFTYAAKLLNLVLGHSSEDSAPPQETFHLASELLDLIVAIELYLGSAYASRIVSAAKPWLPDLILALGSGCILQQTQVDSIYLTISDHFKVHFPSWLLMLAKTELCEISEANSEEDDDRGSEPAEFPEFKKLIAMVVSLLKRIPNLVDAFGVILLAGSGVGLQRRDAALLLGLVHFICVKLIGGEDHEWSGLDMMLGCLPEIYPQIEREIEEQALEEEKHQLNSARQLLEPVWMYHVYETERFSVMEEEMES